MAGPASHGDQLSSPRRIGVKLTKLSKKQADDLGVPVEGPHKPEHHRY